MSVVAPAGARTRRLASLLGGTALVSVAALSMSVTDASAACTVTPAGTVDCLADTMSTPTTNLNGATGASSDRTQQFDNGSNITGTIANNVTVDFSGLQLSLTNAAPPTNTITVTNSGTVTTNQNHAALELNGNGGLVSYAGTGAVSTTAGNGNAMVATNAGDITVTNNGIFNSASNYGLFVRTTETGSTININGSGTISGNGGINASSIDAANINITSAGSIIGSGIYGIYAESTGGNVLIATGSTVSGGTNGIEARTIGTMTVTTGGAVNGTSGMGIRTLGVNGTTTVNAGHNVTGGSEGISSAGLGSGLIDINHTAGTIDAGSIGIRVSQSGSGAIDISQTGGALNGTTNAVSATMTGGGNVTVTLTGGTVGNTSGDAVVTSATTGTTTITTHVNLTSTGGAGINAASTTGTINIGGTGAVSGLGAGIQAQASGAGNVNITTAGAVDGAAAVGIDASSAGGNVTVATGSTVSGDYAGIWARTDGSGAVSVTTGGAVTTRANNFSAATAISTSTTDGNNTVNVGHDVTGINSSTIAGVVFGGGSLEINHTAGTITGRTGIYAQQQDGTTDIRQTGGAINATATAMVVFVNGNGAVNVLLTGGTVNASGGAILSFARFGNTHITTDINLTSTGSTAIVAQTQTGAVIVDGSGAIQGHYSGIDAFASGAGTLSVLGSGTVVGGTVGIEATSGGGNVLVATGNTVSGGVRGIRAATTGNGTVTVTTGGAVTGTSGAGIRAEAASGTAAINVAHSVTGGSEAIYATATSGNIAITNGATVTGATNAVLGSTSGIFNITNSGTLNGNVNVTGSNVASTFANGGIWNAGTASSTFSGNLTNTGTVNLQNGAAGQVVTFAGNYAGDGVYRVDLDAAGNTDRINVGGTANLTGGSVNAQFLPGTAIVRNYTIFSATGGLGGTTFTGGLTASALPGFVTNLSYTPTDVQLNLVAALGGGANLNPNQQNVAGTINSFFNNGGTLPSGFAGVFGLGGATLGNALTQLSGEHATGLQPAANLSTGMFLGAMLDPFVIGRSGGFGAAMGYQAEAPSRVAATARDAFAAYTKAPVAVPFVEPRWSVWGSAYGGRNRTDGDAATGGNDLRATAAGFAVGADYRVLPGTVIGAAVAVGENRWNVSNFGAGNAELAQFGGYFSSRWSSFYVSGAAAVATHRVSTDRTLNIAGIDRLTADFNATSFGGRLEGGYRFGNAVFGATPYAAVQVTSIHTPFYSEVATAGLNQFGLSYQAQSTTDTRTELGAWADTRHQFGNGALITLRGRAAWVHDYNPGSRINAAFQTLPGTSFVVDGAAAPRDAALTSAVAELRMSNGWTLIGKFDGEFSDRSHTLAGTGTLRYAW